MSADVILALDNIKKRFGSTVTADGISLDLERGEFFTLLGPSGSGKSTILRIIAGLERPDEGHVLLEGADVTETPPWRRGLGMVFQQYANFPHMDVADNISYGLRRLAMSAQDQAKRVEELLVLVGLEGFEDRSVTSLSGGEQQRVAIARALAPRPTILLLDEPLSALDEKIRREMQDELRRIQNATATTFVYVTHDQEEALTMSDRIAVLYRGHCVQCDAPEAIFRRPRTRFVARFFRGCNVLEGEHDIADGRSSIRLAGASITIPERFDVPLGRIGIAVRGEDIHVGDEARNCDLVLTGRFLEQVYRGLYTDYRLVLQDEQIVSAMLGRRLDLVPEDEVTIGVNTAAIVPLRDD